MFRDNEAISDALMNLTENERVIGLEAIFGELLQGVKDKEELERIKKYWSLLPKIDEKELFIEAGELSRKQKLLAMGVGLVDSYILAAALKSGADLWTLDKKLEKAWLKLKAS